MNYAAGQVRKVIYKEGSNWNSTYVPSVTKKIGYAQNSFDYSYNQPSKYSRNVQPYYNYYKNTNEQNQTLTNKERLSGVNGQNQLSRMYTLDPKAFNSEFIKPGKINNININDISLHSGIYDFSNFVFNSKTSKIGEGSFGRVFRARHKLNPGCTFAIKQVNKQHLEKMGEKEKSIIKEIATQMSFRHPNIVQVFTYHNSPTDFYLVMEDMVGGTLFERIYQHKFFNETTAFKYFIQVANAVLFLHENKYVHRDIKPENILFDSKDTLKLTDFGWCVKIGLNETRKTFCGTVEYMAPEIVKKESYNKGIDIWALGVLLYEMLHGYSPFNENHQQNEGYKPIFRKIIGLKYQIDPNKNISRNCVNMIHSCLNPDPDKRITIREIFAHPWVKQFEGKNLDEISVSNRLSTNDDSLQQGLHNKSSSFGAANNYVSKTPRIQEKTFRRTKKR